MPNSVFDCKREGESTVDFVANCIFATGLVGGGMELCQYFPPSFCLLPIIKQLCNCFPFSKKDLVSFFGFSFNCVSCPEL